MLQKVPPLRLSRTCIADDFVMKYMLSLSEDEPMTRRIKTDPSEQRSV